MRSLQFVSLLILMCSLNCFAMEEEEQEDRLNQKLLDVSLAGSSSCLSFIYGVDNKYEMEELLKKGANIKVTLAGTGKTPLHLLAERGFYCMAKKLLEKCSENDINCQDKKGNTPLHCAALYLNYSMYRLLTKHGAKEWSTNFAGKTPHKLLEDSQNNSLVFWLAEGLEELLDI